MNGFSINNPSINEICYVFESTQFHFVWIVIDKYGDSNLATFDESIVHRYFDPSKLDGSTNSIYDEVRRFSNYHELIVISDIVTVFPHAPLSRYALAALTRYTNAANFSGVKLMEDDCVRTIVIRPCEELLNILLQQKEDIAEEYRTAYNRSIEFIRELGLEKRQCCTTQECPDKTIPKIVMPLNT